MKSFGAPYLYTKKLALIAAILQLLLSVSFFLPGCHATFPANESTYLNFHIPTKLRHNASWPHAASMFGRLGHGPEGSLVLPVKMLHPKDNNSDHKLCNDNLDQNEVIKELNIPNDGGAPFILLVERGVCTFVKKVRNAQHLGAAAVLIADTEHDHLPSQFNYEDEDDDVHDHEDNHDHDILYIDDGHGASDINDSNHTKHENAFRLADDGSGRDVSIPSMLIARKEYEAIKKVIEGRHNATGTVVAEFAWHIPKYKNKVNMELWYSPIDTHTKQFLASNFSAIARKFDLNELHGNTHDSESYDPNMNLMRFKESPVLLDGKALGCVDNFEAPDEDCYKLCTNGGRYCHVSHRHTDGKDIVTEALRRLCIDKHYNKSPKFYWDYIDHFSNYCWDSDFFANEKCVDDAYSHSNIDKSIIESCFSDSGGPKENRENALLQHSLDMQLQWGIRQSPTVMINHELSPIVSWEGLSPRSVLLSLCDTFAYGDKPHVCYACMMCGDPVACAQRSPMKCLEGDGVEKEDPNAHNQAHDDSGGGGGGGGKKHKHSRWGRWIFGILLIGGCGGAYVYYKKQMEENGGSGLGSYSLQDAFLSDSA